MNDRLCALEAHYSGGAIAVSRRKISDRDPRLAQYSNVSCIPGAMLSGGRFGAKDDYSQGYAENIGKPAVLLELGVLLGVGLAVWADLLPDCEIIGLDIDPARVDWAGLRSKGAFSANVPEVHGFDELADGPERIAEILGGRKIDAMIDDALHDDVSILTAFEKFLPFLAPGFRYFIEDNSTVARKIAAQHPELTVKAMGRLTLVC